MQRSMLASALAIFLSTPRFKCVAPTVGHAEFPSGQILLCMVFASPTPMKTEPKASFCS
jgi:hypothetical protein